MAERPTAPPASPLASPLAFAIASSLAVLPVLLGVLWLVSVARADPAAAAPGRHVDPRRVAALRTFEAAVVDRASLGARATPRALLDGVAACRAAWGGDAGAWKAAVGAVASAPRAPVPAERVAAGLAAIDASLARVSARANAPVERPVGLDGARWIEAASAALAQRAAGCDDLAAAVARVARAGDAGLDAWTWHGRTSAAERAAWAPQQRIAVAAGHAARANPWAGVPGCVVFGDGADAHLLATPGSLGARACALDTARARRDVAPADPATPTPTAGTGRDVAAIGFVTPAHTAGEGHDVAAVDPATPTATARAIATSMAAPAGASVVAPSFAPPVAATEPGPDEPPASARWRVPPSLGAMLAPLDAWRRPATGASARRVVVDGVPVAIGRSVTLTIDPALQALAQKTAACYTGRHDVCRDLGLARTSDRGAAPGRGLLEGAQVRMAAIAVIDVATGRIEALAGARTPCARQEVDGPGRDPGCDARLPWPVRYRPDALLNPAVFHDAMPASTVKPLLAATLLADGDAGARLLAAERAAAAREPGAPPARQGLRGELVRSDSARVLDRLFCADRAFAADCARPWQVAATAAALGWNAGCAEGAPCGRRDLLSGAADAPGRDGRPADAAPVGTRSVSYGRLMVEPAVASAGAGGALRPFAAERLDPVRVGRCAAGADGKRGSDDDWEKCRGGHLVDVVAEGWGQGHARASALGVAGMMAALAAAADGRAAPPPHLVRGGPWSDGAGGPEPRTAPGGALAAMSLHPVAASDAAHPLAAASARAPRGAAAAAPAVAPDAARLVLDALAWTPRTGTARSACIEVLGASACRTLRGVALKTGTPSFPGDGLTLDAIAAACAPPAAERGAASEAATRALARRACGPLRPDKWAVAAWRANADPAAPWSKAIAVLVERNWSVATGLVQAAGDHGPNPAAEIALHVAARRTGLLPAADGAGSPGGDAPAGPSARASAPAGAARASLAALDRRLPPETAR